MPSLFLLFLISIGAFFLGGGMAIAIISGRKKPTPPASRTDDAVVENNTDADEIARKKLEKSTRSIKEILVGLAFAVKNLDGAASNSTNTLTTVRNKLDEMSLPQDIARCQELIIAEVDKVMRSNNGLRSELEKARVEMIKQRKVIESLQVAATIDKLTHIDNRASFDDYIIGAFERFRSSNVPFSIIIIDIDHFKKINDTYGHVIGDRVLEEMAGKLRTCLRSSDFFARYGGEEFVIVLEQTNLAQACIIAEHLRKSVGSEEFELDNHSIKLTISAGCAQVQEGDQIKDLIKHSDEQLYNAKNNGRNTIYPKINLQKPQATN